MHKTWIYTQKYLYFLFFIHLSICLSIWKHDISFIWALSFSMFIPTSLRVRNLASIYFQCMYLFTQSSWCNLSSDHVGRLLHSYVVLVKSVWCSLAVGWFLLACSFHLSLYCRPIGQTHHPLDLPAESSFLPGGMHAKSSVCPCSGIMPSECFLHYPHWLWLYNSGNNSITECWHLMQFYNGSL